MQTRQVFTVYCRERESQLNTAGGSEFQVRGALELLYRAAVCFYLFVNPRRHALVYANFCEIRFSYMSYSGTLSLLIGACYYIL